MTSSEPAQTDHDDHRAVRVFVSSTFLDMQRERDVLVRQTFPALRAKFRARGVELLEVDLRWGITQEQSESGKTLPTLLAEIDRCRPYFIGLLGERYGWVPPETALTDELKASYPSIADAGGHSITEMEIIHGVLRNSETAKRAIFFERDPAWLDTQSAEERAQFVADSDEARAKLADLKARIRASGARIIAYAKPDDIGPAVEGALTERIETQFPEADAPDAFTQTARLHAAYARERRGLHIGAAPYMSALDAWITQPGVKPMLITGASGGGKSTLVANWLAHHRATTPNDIFFEHYLGASPDSGDPILLIRRLWEHLNRATGESVEQPPDDRALIDGLPQRLAQANAYTERSGANVLIVLDGLDKLSSQQDLRWLPSHLPPHVRMLASSCEGAARNAAEERGWATLEVKPLTDAERREFIDCALENWGRELSPARTERILTSPLAGSPLFLKTLLDELRVAGIESELNARLDDYLAARDISDLFARVLQRLESDCGADFVRTAASLIWASRAGLEEIEITAITGAAPLTWATLRNGLGDALRDQAGRVAFSHDFLRQAIEERYIPTDDSKRAAHLAIADQFDKRNADARQAEELPFQLRASQSWDRLEALLVDLDRFEFLRARGDGELLTYWLPLKALGRDPEALLCGALEARAADVAQWSRADVDLAFLLEDFLRFAGARGNGVQHLGQQRTAACERLLGQDHLNTLTSKGNFALTLYTRGDLEGAQELSQSVLEAELRLLGPKHPRALKSMANLALVLSARGDLNGALELHKSALAIRTALLGSEHPDTLTSMNNLAVTLYAQGDLSGAQKAQEQTLEVATRTLGPEHPDTLASRNNLALSLKARGNLEGAEKHEERLLEARARTLGPEHPETLTSMNNLALTRYARGDLNGARNLLKRVLEIMTQALGPEHPSTLTSMGNLAETLRASGDFEGAQKLQESALAIMTQALGPEHPSTLTSMGNLALALSASGDLEGAQNLQERVFETSTRVLGAEHPSTLMGMANLAVTLSARGDLNGALDLHRSALAIRTALLGSEHPDTLTSMNNLAVTLYAQGDLSGAQKVFERIVGTMTAILGSDHPNTRTTAESLAAVTAEIAERR